MNADRSVFATGATDVRVPADLSSFEWREQITCDRRPILFVPGATESFCDWHDRNKSARQPKFFALARSKYICPPTAIFLQLRWRSTNGCRPKCFRAWRDQKFLRLARPMQKCTPTEVFLRLARPTVLTTGANDIKWTPTEIFLRLARPNVFAIGAIDAKWRPTEVFLAPGATERFCIWRKRCKNERRPKCFRALRDRMFSDWRGRSASARRLQFFCDWGDRSTSYRRRKCFRAWRDLKFLRMARPNQKCPPTAVYCDWGERSPSYRRRKCFRAWRKRHFLRFATGTTEVKVTADRSFFRLRRAKY